MADATPLWLVSGSAADPAPTGDAGTGSYEVLMVVPTVPYPPIWGFGQRAFQLARHLARQHRVTVLCYAARAQMPNVEGMAEHVHEVVAVPREPARPLRRRLLQARQVFSPAPFHSAALHTNALQAALNATLGRRTYDAIVLESSQMGWLDLPLGIPVVTDEHNIESELLGRMATSESSHIRRRFNAIEFKRYLGFETRIWDRSAGCAATSQRDASVIHERCPDVPVAVVPNGVDVDQFAPAGHPEVANRLVFTGLLEYRPNYDGIAWFVDEVYPRIQVRRPDVHLQIVGHGSPEVLDSLRHPGIEVTGGVPDLRANLDEAAVAIVPLRIGGGTRLKLVEAMSMGKAIVSTTLGAEGINVVHGEDALLADEPQSFANAVCELLDDAKTRQRLGTNSRVLATQCYSWERSAALLTALIVRVVGPGRSRRARGFQGDDDSMTRGD